MRTRAPGRIPTYKAVRETHNRKRRSALVERSGGSLLIGFISADSLVLHDVKEWAGRLYLMLHGYGSGTEQDDLRLFVFHGIYLLSFQLFFTRISALLLQRVPRASKLRQGG